MYTLRKIDQSDIEINFALGESYSLILRDKEKNAADFRSALFRHFGISKDDPISSEQILEGEKIYGFVFTEFGKMLMLLNGCRYYVMTESGQTFSNVTK